MLEIQPKLELKKMESKERFIVNAEKVLKALFLESVLFTDICEKFKDTKVEKIDYVMGIVFYTIEGKAYSDTEILDVWNLEGIDTENEEPTELLYPTEVEAIKYYEDIVFDNFLLERFMYGDIEENINEFLNNR